MTLDSNKTFEKHLCSVSRATSQRLGILRKSWRVFSDKSLLGRCFRGFILPVLEYCSAVWCSDADTHPKLLDRAVTGARFLTACVFKCDIAHRRSVAVLCMLYKISCNPMHPLNGDLPESMCQCWLQSVPWYAARRCRTSQFRRNCIPLSVSRRNDLGPRIRWCGTGGF